MTKKKEREEDIIGQKDIEREVEEELKESAGEEIIETEEKKDPEPAGHMVLADKYLNNWKRAAADLENYKKGQAKMLGEFRKFASLDAVLQILPVLDNFNASLEHIPEDQKDSAWVTGIIYIKKQLEDILKNNGVDEIEVKEGDEFNPEIHEAVQHNTNLQINADGADMRIKTVAQKGYKIDNKVIRAAKVIVE